MTITIGNLLFEGPYLYTSDLRDRAGVYVILDLDIWSNGSYRVINVIDVGESENGVKTRIEYHNRKLCWLSNRQGTLAVAVCYIPHHLESTRMAVERATRILGLPACGVR
jgi:hypothetical protein